MKMKNMPGFVAFPDYDFSQFEVVLTENAAALFVADEAVERDDVQLKKG